MATSKAGYLEHWPKPRKTATLPPALDVVNVERPLNLGQRIMYPHYRFIQSYCHQGCIGVLIEFGLETWLVTQQDEFLVMSRDFAMHVAASNPESIDSMLSQSFVRDPAKTVGKVMADASARLGERVTITRFVRWDQERQPPTGQPTPPRSPAVAVRLKRA